MEENMKKNRKLNTIPIKHTRFTGKTEMEKENDEFLKKWKRLRGK